MSGEEDRDTEKDGNDRTPETRVRKERLPPPDISAMITLKVDNLPSRIAYDFINLFSILL